MDIRSLDLNLLVALDSLLTDLNVTRAAKRLHISQPALSSRLRRLRVVFGDPLLVPSRRGMIPTDRAVELQAPLRAALEHLREVAALGASFDAQTAELTVSIAASDYVCETVLLPLICGLRTEAPLVRLALCAMDGSRLAEQMEKGEIDIGVMTHPTAPQHLRSRKMFDERYVCIVRREHRAAGAAMDLETFCNSEHIVVSPRGAGFSGPADAALKALGRTRTVVLSVNSFLLVPEIVSRSDLIALVPERLVRNRSTSLWVSTPPIEVDGFSLSLVWHERTAATPGLKWFRDRLMKGAQATSMQQPRSD